MDPSRDLDFELVRERLDNLFIAAANKIEREWPRPLESARGAQPAVLLLVKVSYVTYRSVKSLCTTKSADPYHRPEYALSAPPLARTLADTLSTLILLFNDPVANARWYWASGWREIREHYDRCKMAYGDDPSWASWFAEQEEFHRKAALEWGVTEEEVLNPASIRYWPLPGKAFKQESLPETARAFLSYLNDWVYRKLSSASHLSAPGLIIRGGHLFPRDDEEARDRDLEVYRSDFFFTTIALAMAMLSEVEIGARLGLADGCKYIWTVLVQYSDECKELYGRRYRELL